MFCSPLTQGSLRRPDPPIPRPCGNFGGRCSHRGPRGSCVSYSPTLRGGGTSATWRPKRGSVLRRRPEVEERLAAECEGRGMRYGLALFSGASRVAPFARYDRAFAFVEERAE